MGSVSSGDVIKQTSPPADAAIKPVRADGNDTSDLGLNADLSPLVPLITETVVPLTHTVPLALKQFALSTANARGAIKSAGVDLGGGGGLTDGLSSSLSFVSASCMLGRDALPPTSTGVALAGPSVVPASGTAAVSTAAHVLLPISFSSSDIPAKRVFNGDGAAFATALLGVHEVVPTKFWGHPSSCPLQP